MREGLIHLPLLFASRSLILYFFFSISICSSLIFYSSNFSWQLNQCSSPFLFSSTSINSPQLLHLNCGLLVVSKFFQIIVPSESHDFAFTAFNGWPWLQEALKTCSKYCSLSNSKYGFPSYFSLSSWIMPNLSHFSV